MGAGMGDLCAKETPTGVARPQVPQGHNPSLHAPIDREGETEEGAHLVLGGAPLESCRSTSSAPSINASL
jgi:hypothetical protein